MPVAGGDVVVDSEAQDVVEGVGFRDVAGRVGGDEAEFIFVVDVAVVEMDSGGGTCYAGGEFAEYDGVVWEWDLGGQLGCKDGGRLVRLAPISWA